MRLYILFVGKRRLAALVCHFCFLTNRATHKYRWSKDSKFWVGRAIHYLFHVKDGTNSATSTGILKLSRNVLHLIGIGNYQYEILVLEAV